MSEVSNEVRVIWVADNNYHTGTYLNDHSHPDNYQVYYVNEGKSEFVINGNTSALSKNMFVFAHPGVVHGIKPVMGPDSLNTLEVKFLVIDHDLIDELESIPFICYGNDQLKTILYDVINEGLKKDVFFERSIDHLFCSFLYKMIQQYRNYHLGSSETTIKAKPAAKIKEYIKEHYQEVISLSKLAGTVGYTKNYLCRLFREDSDITINEYLNGVRIHHAIDLLLSTDMDISEISKASGYTNIYHFIKTFKKLTKMSPGSYRRKSIVGAYLAVGPFESKNSVIWTMSSE